MEDEIKSLLKKNLEVARDNNRLLRKMRRSAIIGNVLKVIWWAFLIGVPVAFYYYFLQPLLQEFFTAYQGIQDQAQGLSEAGKEFTKLPEFPGLDALKSFFMRE